MKLAAAFCELDTLTQGMFRERVQRMRKKAYDAETLTYRAVVETSRSREVTSQ